MPATRDLVALFAPLARFYRKSGVELPEIVPLDGSEVPGSAGKLLVHEGDMTSRLRAHHGADIGLRVCSSVHDAGDLYRLVVLFREDTEAPVEFGAIRIMLDKLPEPARVRIDAGKEPLGAILESEKVAFTSHPQSYFSYDSDAFISVLLDAPVHASLYGRCNILATGGETFAEIVEILPGS